MDLILSAKLILGTFTASTITTVLLCHFHNVPFINPNQNRYQFYNNLKYVIPSTVIVLIQSILVSSYLLVRFVDSKPHTFIHNIDNILKYSVIAEFVYYIYHRIVHTKDYYRAIHSMHHQNIDVYPIDTFYMTRTDSLFLIASLGTPFLVLNMNYFESIVSLYIYITAAYLEHSNFFIMHHAKHHKILFCNFCIMNPIFDLLIGTYR